MDRARQWNLIFLEGTMLAVFTVAACLMVPLLLG
jgi:hypothetical protein